MKAKKIISFNIALVLMFNGIFNNISFANHTYYEYLEGKFLTIKDTYSDNIEELEVFGDTIQNSNDLSDIKSVGTLYVDENNQPILDKKGNKQYMINLTSTNKNLLNNKNVIQGVYNYGTIGGTPIFRTSDVRLTLSPEQAIPMAPNTVITCKSEKFNFAIAELNNGVSLGDTGWQQGTVTITTKPQTTHVAFNISKGDAPAGTEQITTDDLLPGDIMLCYGDESIDLVDHLSSDIEIILPHQLQKVGDVSDKLYYDKNSNRFVVEKNIEDLVLTGQENWYFVTNNTTNTAQFGVYDGFEFTTLTRVMSDRFTQTEDTLLSKDEEMISIRTNSNGIDTLYIRIDKTKLDEVTVSCFKKWLSQNNTLVKYKLKSPKISYIKSEDLKLYDGETNIFDYTTNTIQPTIKFKVDRLNNEALYAVENAIKNSSIASISDARSLVNQMGDSLIKDNLQEQLNSLMGNFIGSIDKKTSSVNTDVYIKLKNTASISLNTNSIIFEDFSAIEDMEKTNAVTLTVGSSLPYDISANLDVPIQNIDKNITLDNNLISIKSSDTSEYLTFGESNNTLTILNNEASPSANHGIDIRLNGGKTGKADIYKTVIKFTLNQK